MCFFKFLDSISFERLPDPEDSTNLIILVLVLIAVLGLLVISSFYIRSKKKKEK